MDPLQRYRDKRAFDHTPEPEGAPVDPGGEGSPRFVVQKHDARRLHYDVRLEADGVLISWAVPKGPSLDPSIKRLAVHVEDHPLDYQHFEGVIPGAQYGAGTVIIWDEGTYRNLTQRNGQPVGVTEAVRAGHVSVWLEGTKLQGGWSLTRTGAGGAGGAKEQWIMVKRADERAEPGVDIERQAPNSVRSGRNLDDLRHDVDAPQWSGDRATWALPMLAELARPSDHFRASGTPLWQYQRKLDGLRCVAVRNGDEVELWSRNHLSFNARFPSVVEALGRLPVSNFTLDGEIVAFDGTRTSFARLQQSGAAARPVYCVFDVLHLLGHDTRSLPLADRQALLGHVVDLGPTGLSTGALSTVETLSGDPEALLRRACASGWEGLVAKRVGSVYRAGRSADWQKLKCTSSQELVIGGWTEPSGARQGFGALLVGFYDDQGGLRFAGKVGTGFSQRTLRDLAQALDQRAVDQSPFADKIPLKGVHWVLPELVAAVAFTEWTTDGRLRHPSFQGLRPDKPARSVRRESPA